ACARTGRSASRGDRGTLLHRRRSRSAPTRRGRSRADAGTAGTTRTGRMPSCAPNEAAWCGPTRSARAGCAGSISRSPRPARPREAKSCRFRPHIRSRRGRCAPAHGYARAACAIPYARPAARRSRDRHTTACRASLHTTAWGRSCCSSSIVATPFEQSEQWREIVLTVDAQDKLPDPADSLAIERQAREVVEFREQLVLRHRRTWIASGHVDLIAQHVAVAQ